MVCFIKTKSNHKNVRKQLQKSCSFGSHGSGFALVSARRGRRRRGRGGAEADSTLLLSFENLSFFSIIGRQAGNVSISDIFTCFVLLPRLERRSGMAVSLDGRGVAGHSRVAGQGKVTA